MIHRRTMMLGLVGAMAIFLIGNTADGQDEHEKGFARSAGTPWDCVINTTDHYLLVTVTTGTTGTGPKVVPPGWILSFGYQPGNEKATVVAYRYNSNLRVTSTEFTLINQSAGAAACLPISPEGKPMTRDQVRGLKAKGEVIAP